MFKTSSSAIGFRNDGKEETVYCATSVLVTVEEMYGNTIRSYCQRKRIQESVWDCLATFQTLTAKLHRCKQRCVNEANLILYLITLISPTENNCFAWYVESLG